MGAVSHTKPLAAILPRRRATVAIFVLVAVFLIALPKGGITSGGVPVTFGYMLLGACALPALLGLARVPLQAPALMQLAAGWLPLGLMTVHVTLTGTDSDSHLIVYATVFALLPLLILGLYAPYLERLTEREIATALTWTIRFAVAWGLMNFVLFAVAHQFLRVPFLTVNASDLQDIFARNNRRGALMKLVSTYNNGNIYGACMVMLETLYLLFEQRRGWRIAFLLSIVLTLSRTAWLGLIALFFIMAALGQIRLTRPAVWVLIGGALVSIATLLPAMGWRSDSIIDDDLGGRLDQLSALSVTPLGVGRIHVPEIVYAGLIESFGVIGFGFGCVALGFPLVFGLQRRARLSPLRKAALAGIASYLLLACSDGAFILAPVLPLFLGLCALLYRRGFAPVAALARVEPGIAGEPTFAR